DLGIESNTQTSPTGLCRDSGPDFRAPAFRTGGTRLPRSAACCWRIQQSFPARGRWTSTTGPTCSVVPKGQAARLAYISEFIEQAKASGLVQRVIERAGCPDTRKHPHRRTDNPPNAPGRPSAFATVVQALMSALDQKQTFAVHSPMSALDQKRTWRI